VMVFWLIGGKVTMTAYISDYIADTGVISTSDESVAVLVIWIFISVGRLAGLQDQILLETDLQNYRHLTFFLFGGTLSVILLLTTTSSLMFWIGIAGYGFFNGPCVGYCYDLNNRLTVPSEKGMSVVMFGLNFGASMVPYLTTLAWDEWGSSTLLISTLLTMSIPFPFLLLTRKFAVKEIPTDGPCGM